MTSRKSIPAKTKIQLLSRKQCANNPSDQAPGCSSYCCPLWAQRGGYFDESGYEIDHIIEVKHGGTNDLSNLQLLCPCCHAVKTKRCAKQKWDFTSIEIEFGVAHMETNMNKRKRTNSI
jgi:5-methylcytosine-specific restriction endonuclease McrA